LQNGKGTPITTITIPTVVGNLTGNASTATSATSATTAGTVTTAAQPAITSVGVLSSLRVGNTSFYVFSDAISKTQSNTHTITIPFTSQGSQWSGFIVEVIFTATYTDVGEAYSGRAIYSIANLTAVSDVTEIQDIGTGCSFSAVGSGMNLIITETTTASGGNEPNRIGATVFITRGNIAVNNVPTGITIA
jgi:hypothetical protein